MKVNGHIYSYKHIFGPVLSRRLGISLGIDLIPHKVCTLNCIYCECGRTNNLTVTRDEYQPTQEVINELESFLSTKPKLDFVTFSGSGEPTLHSKIGEITSYLKKNFPQYKVALLTNGTLLGDKSVQHDVMDIDLIIPSIDGVFLKTINKINRPHPSLDFKKIYLDLIDFSKKYKGQHSKKQLWIEVFIVSGINDSPEELKDLKELLLKINLDKIQLNSLDRPGAEDNISIPGQDVLENIVKFLQPLPVEIIGKYNGASNTNTTNENDIKKRIIELIERRPSTKEDITSSLGLDKFTAESNITSLLNENQIIIKSVNSKDFLAIK